MNSAFGKLAGIAMLLALVPMLPGAQDPPPAEVSADAMARTLKSLLIGAMPAVLYERADNWGHQTTKPVGVKWVGLRPEVMKSPRNQGDWKKLVISPQALRRTLDLKISDLKTIDKEKQTFKVFFTFQLGVTYEHQNWEGGVRLWSNSVRARAQFKLDMDCENTLRVEIGKDLLPDFIVRLRVLKAKVRYDNLVVEHIAGIGGSGAKLLGQAVHDTMNQWRPSIERDLLAKASDAIVKAADTREIRFGFGSLLKKK